jgi:hypothetical protein
MDQSMTSPTIGFTTFAFLLALGGAPCAQQPSSQAQGEPAVTTPVTPDPAAWERRVGDLYENRGLARVERIGQLWMLTILCNGAHSTYIEPSRIDPAPYAKGHVAAQYRYVDRENRDARCVPAPCSPIVERRIVLERLERIEATAAQAQAATASCQSGTP